MRFSLGLQLFTGSDENEEAVPALLFELLKGVRDHGNLTIAAKMADVSYRKAWNLVRHWSDRFGVPLIDGTKGRGTRLTELGLKLLWTRNYLDSKGVSSVEEIQGFIQSELNDLLGSKDSCSLRVCASHCISLDILQNLYQGATSSHLSLELQGSRNSLASLFAGQCDLAGFHVAQGELGAGYLKAYSGAGDFSKLDVVMSHQRQQGLIVAPGNPLSLESIKDLRNPNLRLINRQQGSGTRVLLDLLLEKSGLRSRDVQGYDDIEQTHTAVCAKVANQRADVAIGSKASAAQFGLGFIPLVEENYYFCYPQQEAKSEGIRQFLTLLRSPAWKQAIKQIPGMRGEMSGSLCSDIQSGVA